MDIGVISMRYARALLKSAAAGNEEEAVYRDMQTLAKSYVEVPQLRRAIDNPTTPAETKLSLLTTAAGGKSVTALTQRFAALVLREGREAVMQFMANSYITLYRKQKNVISGRLTTAVAVAPATGDRLRQMVEQRTQSTVEFETDVNPDIIGGFILEYDTYRMDASVRTQLGNILKTIKQ